MSARNKIIYSIAALDWRRAALATSYSIECLRTERDTGRRSMGDIGACCRAMGRDETTVTEGLLRVHVYPAAIVRRSLSEQFNGDAGRQNRCFVTWLGLEMQNVIESFNFPKCHRCTISWKIYGYLPRICAGIAFDYCAVVLEWDIFFSFISAFCSSFAWALNTYISSSLRI